MMGTPYGRRGFINFNGTNARNRPLCIPIDNPPKFGGNSHGEKARYTGKMAVARQAQNTEVALKLACETDLQTKPPSTENSPLHLVDHQDHGPL
ncbi:hypothetical protein TNCT_150571 [Trichonephila clavata]|uniref:Uncharacterized protein n=1 Tax=Trichonephila clavata TaxID=2740835 RepID=A0A8X6F8R7_TRICU|nr:hypothetical protein TNCT_150571 [Trichonephila clavata]